MNENIDLTKILKDCPYGWEFYSSVYGNVQFENIMLFIPLSSLSGYGNCKYIPVFHEKPCKTPIKVKADGILRELQVMVGLSLERESVYCFPVLISVIGLNSLLPGIKRKDLTLIYCRSLTRC